MNNNSMVNETVFEPLPTALHHNADSTPEKPTRHISTDSLKKSTINRDCQPSPVSVAKIFDDECLLNTIDNLPYNDYDDELDEFFACTMKQKKRVRFQLDEDGNVEEDVCLYSFPDYKLTSKLVKECWYSKDDRIQAKAEIQKQCREHATSIPNVEEYHDAMVAAITYLVQSDDDAEDPIELSEDMMNAMTTIAQVETRGMERSLQFHMGIPRIGTKTNVHAVLRVQTLIRELDSSKYDEFEVEELIADQSIINSQYGIRWAKMIALGDAANAKKTKASNA
jgi:hypothetical protein